MVKNWNWLREILRVITHRKLQGSVKALNRVKEGKLAKFFALQLVLGNSPKLGQQPKFGWANFFQILAGPNFWLGQFFTLFGWAIVWLLAQFWLGQFWRTGIMARPFWLGLWLGHRLAQPNFFFHFGWANNGPAKWAFPQNLLQRVH